MTDNEAKGRFTDTGFIAGTTPDTPPAKATQPPGTLPILGGHASSNSAAERVKALKPLSLLPGGPPIWLRRSDVLAALEADAIPSSVEEGGEAKGTAASGSGAGSTSSPPKISPEDATPNSVAEQIVAARNAIRAIAVLDKVDADSFSMATAAYEAMTGHKLTNDETEQALDLAFKPEQWS